MGIGIIGLEAYFPKYYVEQSELECHDRVSTGKYTIGLGQEQMSVCSMAEDVISLSLNAFNRLMNRFNLDSKSIGRIEVGSESNPDRAKSIKSHLLSLLAPSNISGGDNVQACYGGTAALLNAAAWMESSQWQPGKYAIVLAADVAVYPSGGARATGGAGSVAILLARDFKNTPIKLERCFGHYSAHVYDFYKPNPVSEYPIVDGPLSVTAYIQSALHAYSDWNKNNNRIQGDAPFKTISDSFEQIIFHSPYSKIVYKAFCQLQLFNPSLPPKIKDTASLSPEALLQINGLFAEKVGGSLYLSKNLGNSYCAAIFFNLIGFLMHSDKPSRIGVFSYGSGSMSTFFSLFYDPLMGAQWIPSLCSEIQKQLDDRIKISPSEYEVIMKCKNRMYTANNNFIASESDLKDFTKGTFYLHQIDSEFRRIYKQKQ